MVNTFLIIDANNVAARNFFGMEPMGYKGVRTEAVYGFFRDLIKLRADYRTEQVIVCFDGKTSNRKQMLPTYKSSREKMKADLAKLFPHRDWKYMISQLEVLYHTLKLCGLRNVFREDGFEADDLIAGIVKDGMFKSHQGVIVSRDQDLYQCLRKRVVLHDPKTGVVTTRARFKKEWGVTPNQWDYVKAIAGDTTDDIEGVDGVAEKTAAKFVRGDLPKNGKLYQRIESQRSKWITNLPLVSLPLPGTPECPVYQQKFDRGLWEKALTQIGIHLRP